MVNERYTSFRITSKEKPGSKSGKNSSKKLDNKKLSELSDIEEALRHLEVQEGQQNGKQSCNCAGRKHPLNTVTPNCLNCGKILCCRNSSTICSFCNEKLLSNDELEAITMVLQEEKEKLVGQTSRSTAGQDASVKALEKANSALSRLLEYQNTSAIRTHIIDQASDFDLPGSGANKWATATEQAEQLKRQQRLLKQQKKKNDRLQGRSSNVLSIDLKGNKVVLNTSNDYNDPDSDEDDSSSKPSEPQVRNDSSSKTPSTSTKIDKKLISPAYNRATSVDANQIVEQPVRLQTPDEYAYLEV